MNVKKVLNKGYRKIDESGSMDNRVLKKPHIYTHISNDSILESSRCI